MKWDIGIIGGGQLGKMIIEEGLRYNLRFCTLDPEEKSPASFISHHHITGSLHDEDKITELVTQSKVTTYEIEHINTAALKKLESEGHILYPSPSLLELIQDKGAQKEFYQSKNIPTSSFFVAQDKDQALSLLNQFTDEKIVIKSCKGGYDGKGVSIMNRAEVNLDNFPFDGPCVLEQFVTDAKEISVMVARGIHGEMKCFPAVEMEFDPEANLVSYLICPTSVDENILKNAEQISMKCIEEMKGIGIFAVELFIDQQGQVLVNEIAPRPHNSMHHTIEACYTSQYEQLIRIVTGMPLGSTDLIQPAAMINVLGGDGFSGPYTLKYKNDLLKMPGVYIHMYDKAESKPKRKLGHITVMASTLEEVKKIAAEVKGMADIVSV